MDDIYPKLVVLVTKDKVFFHPPQFPFSRPTLEKNEGNGIYVHSLGNDTNEVFVGKDWVASSGVLKYKWIVDLCVYPLMVGFIFGLFVVPVFFLAFIGQLLSIIVFKFKLTFKDTSRLFMVAATPDILVFFAQHTANITFPGQNLYNVALLAVYFSYAILSVRRESKKMVRG